ncbi:MAG TPA: alpha/beta fold hydrolase [Gaiellaceae bacterium]|nr:alpha/beta fold hydrolase [Gaiellaceae bacterium]
MLAPDEVGFVERGGVRIHWSRWGDGDRSILFLPPWAIVHSRIWKAQIPWFARRFRVLTFDPRGNGRSDRPEGADAYSEQEYADDALAVLDTTGTDAAGLVSISRGAQRALLLGDQHPERVTASAFIGPALPFGRPLRATFADRLDSDEGWNKYNEHYWRKDYRGFLEFFFGQIYNEPHSTKQTEDCVAWGLETDAETLIASQHAPGLDAETTLEICGRVRYPVLVLHGEGDAIIPLERGRALAEATGGRLVVLEGSGHCPQGRVPVEVNLLLEDFFGGGRRPVRQAPRPRALFVSSPIGLGHAQRDLAIARELRARRPELEVHWLAQHPVTEVLAAAGETIHPASAWLANESAYIDARTGAHDLHVFQVWRGLDEILVANFMLFLDVVREQRYELWVGDEAWELDYFLHEQPELKTSPYAFLTDFVGWLPVAEDEAWLTADYNAENIAHVEGRPDLRDAAVFVGGPDDVVPDTFGPGLPSIRDWVPRHFDFSGYVLPFDPADYADTERLRRELGHDPKRPLIVASAGGSGVGLPLLRRIAAAFSELRRDVDAELLLVCGPRIDPEAIDPAEGMRAVGYVHDLYRTLACCDLAVVQGGLTTGMELVANRRPFIYVPLRRHFEQNRHVAFRLQRYGAPPPTSYDETSPARLAELMRARLGARVDYLPVETGGAARAAELILIASERSF